MIAAIVFALIGFACLVYSIFAFKERGPLISSIYFVAAPAQREKMKTKVNYRFVATVFLGIAIICFSSSIGLLFDLAWMAMVTLGLALVLVLYVIWLSVKLEAKKNKG